MSNEIVKGGDATETPRRQRCSGGAAVDKPGDSVKSPGYIYLIHLDEGMVVRTEPNGRVVYALHYIGWTENHDRRLAEHSAGRGSSFMAEVGRRRIAWRIVKMWEGTRNDERKIKRRKEATRFCPVCVANSDSNRGIYIPDLKEVEIGVVNG